MLQSDYKTSRESLVRGGEIEESDKERCNVHYIIVSSYNITSRILFHFIADSNILTTEYGQESVVIDQLLGNEKKMREGMEMRAP